MFYDDIQALKVGDTAYYARSASWGSVSFPVKGVVTKISPSGQITVLGDGKKAPVRFHPRRGDEIGGNAYLIDAESYGNRLRAARIKAGAREVREKLQALGGLNLDHKQAVIDALEEALNLAKLNLIDEEA